MQLSPNEPQQQHYYYYCYYLIKMQRLCATSRHIMSAGQIDQFKIRCIDAKLELHVQAVL